MYNSNSVPSLSDIAAVTNGNNGMFGGDGSWILVLIILIAIFGGWGNGGGFGGGRGTSVYEGYVLNNDFSVLSNQMSQGFATQERKLDSISNGICSLGYDQLAQMNGINTNIMSVGNSLQGAVKDCCCQTQQNIKDTQYVISDKSNAISNTVQSGFCQTNFNAQTNTRDIIDSQNSGTQAILSKLDAMETNRLREKLEAERDAKYALQGQLDRAQLRTQIVDDVRPCPRPAYITCNPFGCNCQQNVYGYGYPYGTTIA